MAPSSRISVSMLAEKPVILGRSVHESVNSTETPGNVICVLLRRISAQYVRARVRANARANGSCARLEAASITTAGSLSRASRVVRRLYLALRKQLGGC
jgi:hypothetical protein